MYMLPLLEESKLNTGVHSQHLVASLFSTDMKIDYGSDIHISYVNKLPVTFILWGQQVT